MTPAEAAALLTVAAAYDNRKPDEDQAKAWAMALEDLRFHDCRDAIVAHYRRTREWLMPSDVIDGVKSIRRNRVLAFGPVLPPPDMETAAELAWVADANRRIADGEVTKQAELYDPGELTRRPVEALGLAGRAMPDDATRAAAIAKMRADVAQKGSSHA